MWGAQHENWHKRNIFYNRIPFCMNNHSFYSFKEHKYNLSDIIWFIREVNKSIWFFFLKHVNFEYKKNVGAEKRDL